MPKTSRCKCHTFELRRRNEAFDDHAAGHPNIILRPEGLRPRVPHSMRLAEWIWVIPAARDHCAPSECCEATQVRLTILRLIVNTLFCRRIRLVRGAGYQGGVDPIVILPQPSPDPTASSTQLLVLGLLGRVIDGCQCCRQGSWSRFFLLHVLVLCIGAHSGSRSPSWKRLLSLRFILLFSILICLVLFILVAGIHLCIILFALAAQDVEACDNCGYTLPPPRIVGPNSHRRCRRCLATRRRGPAESRSRLG
mmetsp:Transcript_128976/g.413104  ORF Transcript_128976/g.413104 Transcript_128976/m.413104 type:complete len:252 (-) Transcript_128976:157-912(-)